MSDADALTPQAREAAERLVRKLVFSGFESCAHSTLSPCGECAVDVILAYAAEVRRQERERILGQACPCKCGQEPWHQRGVCREGEEVLMAQVRASADPGE